MPYECVISNRKGNYKNGPNVHIFSFLEDKELSDIWIHTIKRDNCSHIKISILSIFLS